jgi:hypothetical protein
MSPKLHESVPPLMEHPAVLGDILHDKPAGNGSLSVTAVAVPGPLLVTTILKPA